MLLKFINGLIVKLLSSIFEEIVELYRYRWVTFSFVKSTLLLRYRRSFLGFFWSLLNPIISYVVIGTVFYLLSRGLTPNYFVYMFIGSAIFNLISVTTNASTMIMLSNEHYIKKIYLPKSIFIVNAIFFETVNFLFSIIALLILGFAMGRIHLSWSLISIPLIIFYVMLMNFGIASFLSVLTVFFRDFIHIVPILTQALFYTTPILYSLDIVSKEYQHYFNWNPFFHIVECFREPFYSGHLAKPINYIVLISFSIICFLLGFIFLKRNENRIVFRL